MWIFLVNFIVVNTNTNPSLHQNIFSKYCRIGFAYIGRVGSTAVTVSLSIERYLAFGQHTSNTSNKLLFWAPIIFPVVYSVPKFFELSSCEALHQSITQHHLNTTGTDFTYDLQNDYHNNATQKDDSINLVHLNLTHGIHGMMDKDSEGNDAMVQHCSSGGMQPTALRKNELYIIFYVVISKVVLIEIIPWLTIITLNLLTWKKMKSFQRRREALLNGRNPGT